MKRWIHARRDEVEHETPGEVELTSEEYDQMANEYYATEHEKFLDTFDTWCKTLPNASDFIKVDHHKHIASFKYNKLNEAINKFNALNQNAYLSVQADSPHEGETLYYVN